MCHSKHTRVITCGQSHQSRCPNCYKKAPYHRRHCSVAAAAIEVSTRSQHHSNSTDESQLPPPPPSYDQIMASNGQPTTATHESRHRPRRSIDFAINWGMEKVQRRRDEKKFIAEFENRRSMERQSTSSSESSRAPSYEYANGAWVGDGKH